MKYNAHIKQKLFPMLQYILYNEKNLISAIDFGSGAWD